MNSAEQSPRASFGNNWMRKLAYSSLIAVAMYFFVIAIVLIKEAALKLGNSYLTHVAALGQSPLKALGAGWLSSAIVQSGGAVAATGATFVGTGALSIASAFYLILGTRIGATSTGLIASLFTKSKLKKGFRHGFEIAVVNNIYNISIVAMMFIFEYFTHFFSKTGTYFSGQLEQVGFLASIPDVVKLLTGWIVDIVLRAPTIVILLVGFAMLIFMLNLFTRAVLGLSGGRKKAHKKIDRYFGTATKAFLAGLLITMLIPSTNVTISLLVPLAAANVLDLKRAIPYIIGANIGTVMDVVIASLVTGQAFSISTAAVYVMFTVVGAAIWLPNINYLHRATKWLCKHVFEISRSKAVAYFAVFMLIPVLMILLL